MNDKINELIECLEFMNKTGDLSVLAKSILITGLEELKGI